MKSVNKLVKNRVWNQTRILVYKRVEVEVRALVWWRVEMEVRTGTAFLEVRFPVLDQLDETS